MKTAELPYILIVEDDPDTQTVLAHILDYLDQPITVVETADEALDLLGNKNFHCHAAIIDLALPGKDGWMLINQLKSDAYLAKLPCIAVTGYDSARIRDEAMRKGFQAYYPKPLDAVRFAYDMEQLLKS